MNRFSNHGLEFLKQREGSIATMYRDSKGLPTIGVGHLLTKSELSSGKIFIKSQPVRWGVRGGLTDQQILDLLEQDVHVSALCVNMSVTVPLNQNQFDALASFAFNIGNQAFQASTLVRLLNQKQYDAVPAQLRRWVHAGPKTVAGLVDRREKEITLWNTPVNQESE